MWSWYIPPSRPTPTASLAAAAGVVALLAMATPARAQLALFGGHYYGLTSGVQSWTAAEAEAVARRGHLAAINSAAENEFLVTRFLAAAHGAARPYWIGLSDSAVEGQFQWSSGESLTYTNWAAGEPNNFPIEGGEDYAAINWQYANLPSGVRGTWNDTPLAGTVTGNPMSDGPYQGIFELPFSYAADFDEEGDVDAADLLSWRTGFGAISTAMHAQGDADGDGNVDGRDVLLWQVELGKTAMAAVSLPAAISAPEPAAGALLLLVVAARAAVCTSNGGQAGRRQGYCYPDSAAAIAQHKFRNCARRATTGVFLAANAPRCQNASVSS